MLADRLIYPHRSRTEIDPVSEDEVEAWVRVAGEDHFVRSDDAFVARARNLGVTSGMVLDLGSRLALIPMKILWEEEGLLAIGVYGSPVMAERGRETAQEWNLDQRMFFQVGEPGQMKFKTHYFDMVVSDGLLHQVAEPEHLLREIDRVTKPGGAILLRELARPARFGFSRHIEEHAAHYEGVLRHRFEQAARSGFTPGELTGMVERAGPTGALVIREGIHVLVEREGSDDPDSWLKEREKYT
jgi:SAM-dependent methyltransferase